MQNILEVKNLCYAYHNLYGETAAIDHVSFAIKEGEFVAIVGPSGCGKSTLLSLIAGLLIPEQGEIRVLSENAQTFIGYMLQKDHLLEWRSIYKNAVLGLELNHRLTREKIEFVNHLLKEYGLWEFRDKAPSELSGGMKQRAALIRTLAMEPELLLLDEPFSALDYQTRLMVSGDICKLIRASGKSVILITHDLSEAIALADRVIVLSKRPAIIKKEIQIKLTLQDSSPLAARNAPEFQTYFNLLWEELNDETKR